MNKTALTAASEDIIPLDPKDSIAEGGERWVFRHPDYSHILIKMLKRRKTEMFNRWWTFGHLSQRFLPASRYRSTAKQYDEYRRLVMENLFDPGFELPVAHLYGFVKTSLGYGCLTERITDETGRTAPNLQQRIEAGTFTEADRKGLNRFVARLYDISICAADMGPANFVHGYRGASRPASNRVPQWVLVDGFGDRYAITARTYSRRIRLRGMDSRFRKGKKVRGLRWCPEARRFEFEEDDRPAT
ncbi:PhoP regulatory network YrbL family protein [Rhodovulum sulfidophilum]|uniref:YrbL family protein n=1 Tax=Rhodovulum sulfidophilum TaxID=35806 RepID=UPI001920BE96|nr:YrbL family protein [Rhodovulum sulfidophilum]MBL3572612.1 hypothetical protein [Rhodovulum sulfidophilum]MCE8433571.1 PhoP regulatory network YrbL family protein [Rhodovulum sulfidophilum]MCF4116689.1 PhoP regulatory network YrbL family protein [Rhodovulum sulfidophilum]